MAGRRSPWQVGGRRASASRGRERRRAPRTDIKLLARVVFEDSGLTADGICRNLSKTGVLVRATRTQGRGTRVRLETDAFSATAEIVWTRKTDQGYLLGMRFVSLGWGARRAIRGIVGAGAESGTGADGGDLSTAGPSGQARSKSGIMVSVAMCVLAFLWAALRIVANAEPRPSEAMLAEDLRWTVAALVWEIEAFRDEEGRLPEEAELIAEELIDPEIDDQLHYSTGMGIYVVSLVEDGVAVEYDGSIPLYRWVVDGKAIQ